MATATARAPFHIDLEAAVLAPVLSACDRHAQTPSVWRRRVTMEPALRSLADALEAGLSVRALLDDAALIAAWPPPVRATLRTNAAGASS